jgi:hypothetical protein
MLSKLFGSNARVKILKLFLLNPDQKFFVREVARNLELQLNSVHREIANLVSIGLLAVKEAEAGELDGTKVTKQDKKYYHVQENFVFYKELKALLVKSEVLYEKEFTDKLKKLGKIKLLILTGFFVNEEAATVDLFVVGDFNKERLAKIVKELEGNLVREINYAVMTEEEFNYRREIADVFLYRILDGTKIVIVDENGVI